MNEPHIAGLAFRERCYRAALLFLPRSFREEYGIAVLEAFRDGYRDRFVRLGPRAARRFARHALGQLFTCAIQLRLNKRTLPHRPRSRSPQLVPNIFRDVAVAARGFLHKPGFFCTAVLTMGLGIGATTTVFSVVDKVLLRRLPYPDADRLVYFTESSHSLPDFQDWREGTSSFELLAGARAEDYDWFTNGEPRRVTTALVTAGFFDLFGARPIAGQLFNTSSQSGAQPIVLSHQLWQTQLGSNPDILGASLTINGHSTIVVGVLDPQFQLPEIMVGKNIDVWMPFDETQEFYANRNVYVLEVAGRLRPTQTVEVAQAQLAVVAESQAAEHGDRYLNDDGTVRVERIVPFFEAMTSQVSDTLMLLMGAVVLMLLIACANVANLFLARGTDRHREIVLRVALGAGRRRITAQLLAEAIVLSLAGGLLGVGLAFIGVRAFAQLNPVAVPRIETVTIDGRVLLFTLITSVVTGIVFGVLPAVQSARSDANEVLKEATGRTTSSRAGRRVRDGLVVVEIAMSLVLTAGAAVLFHSLLAAQRTDPGIDANHVVSVRLALNSLNGEERLRFSNELLESLEANPVTTSAAAGVAVPFVMLHGRRCCWFTDINRVDAPNAEMTTVVHPVTTGYFKTLGATVMRGRDFTVNDRSGAERTAIINATLAQRLFGNDDPIGGRIELNDAPLTVVGVVADIRHWGLQEDIGNEVYMPYERSGQFFSRYHLLLRTNAPLQTATDVIRSTIWSIRPDLPVESIVRMQDQISESIADSRFYSILFMVFATISLTLAASGVYSSMLYSVGQRYRELGVRLAIGARPRDITTLILARGSAITALGVAAGLAGAFALVHAIEHLVIGVSATDFRTLAAAVTLLASVAMAACWIPARRASRANPNQVLRFE